MQDLIRFADLAPNLVAYLKAPNKFDFPNVDTPDPKLIFSHKTVREKAADLAKLASKTPLEVWIKDTSQHDIEGVDTPQSKNKEPIQTKILRKFRIVKKTPEKPKESEKPKETSLKPKELDVNNPLSDKTHMPSHAEIVNKAQELYMKDHRDETTLPNEADLKSEEADYLRNAQIELMTSESGHAEKVVMGYVENLRNELNKIGFDVVPLSGFEI